MTRRELAGTGLVGALAALAAPRACAWATAAPPDLAFVDPELRPLAQQMVASNATLSELSAATLAASRKGMEGFAGPPLATPAFERRLVKRTDGGEVPVYVVDAKPGTRRPAILHMHGGGYVMGDAKGGLAELQRTAAALDCVIVSVDYRLAPETSYAGSIEDNYAGLRWLHGQAEALGADPARIAVMGESAGGGHAALLALTARDRGEVPLVLQVLTYPMLDDRTGTTLHPPAPIGTLVWTAANNRYGWRSFLGQDPGTARVPAKAVPARHASLAGLPPAFVGVGSIDLFRDEDVAYARRLTAAGVPTELLVVPGAFHGFDLTGIQTAVAKRFTAAKIAALRRAFSAAPGDHAPRAAVAGTAGLSM